MRKWILSGLAIMLLCGLSACKEQPEKVEPIDHSLAVQMRRENELHDLIKRRIFYKFEWSGKTPILWVAPGFYGLKSEEQQTLVQVAYLYAFTDTSSRNNLLVKDSRSGKPIGSFASQSGLQLK